MIEICALIIDQVQLRGLLCSIGRARRDFNALEVHDAFSTSRSVRHSQFMTLQLAEQ